MNQRRLPRETPHYPVRADPQLEFQRTVSRRLVHRAAVAEVFVTDAVVLGEDHFLVGGQWPRDHALYHPDAQRRSDPLLFAETIRQALVYLAHWHYEVPLTHRFVGYDMDFEITDPGALCVGGRPMPVELEARWHWTDRLPWTHEQWAHLTKGMVRLGHEVKEAYGLDIVVHPHADTHLDTEDHVEHFLDSTDSELVNLCLDTGHYAYCGGDSVKLIETYGERIGYLHLKQVDPEILADVVTNEVPFGPAVQRGVMCEPPSGVPELEPVLVAAQKLGVELFAIVEQDMYPCEPDRPLPIAVRTRKFLRSCGA